MKKPLDIVVLGLTLSSSWGNGHATTFRALIRGLKAEGHRVLFLERDVPWYAEHRDLPEPDFCELLYYSDIGEMLEVYAGRLMQADAVIVGSYVPDGVMLIDRLQALDLKRLCFYDIDTPGTLAKLDRGDEEYLAKRQVALFDIYFSFSGGQVLTRLEEQYRAKKALPLYCSVDAERYQHTGETFRWDLGYLGTFSPDRQPTVEKLLIEPARRLPHLRFVVAGPQYPADIDWPKNVERINHLPPADHSSFYSGQRFTLNVTRADMIAAGWSPSVRLFEAASCGTPIISDYWRGLDELLPDQHAVLIAAKTEDVLKALTGIDERQRRSLAARAKAIVLEGHTGLARARGLIADLSQLPERQIHPQSMLQPVSA
ncbi:glycosyltransferase [Rhizobium lentis]|uniref:CgeB family protein n=1 Tax=Rhizobium lentis TaxID=1138194 RepID=UPI001C829A17|nr:glycosyltransferase [Rhizobium lentis]MBX5086686.1 glycosyltransferase [Rhizobium lentis]MBX5099331.1 glycosyltransferase [Rhizobium lentis]MBX5124131.1 glycosyltransferase [Rhizobium lentis]